MNQKVLLKKRGWKSREELHDYVEEEELRSLTNIGPFVIKAMRGQMGLFWHHTPTGQVRDFRESIMQICCCFGSQCRHVLLEHLQS